MSAKQYFSYIRVSTLKQGQTGTSLTEQQAAIERYAAHWDLSVVKQFEEKETAAKRGRPVFSQVLSLLTKRQAHGVIMHKIDRSARNLKDWADLGELIDQGIEVHFVNESLDLHSRGGRLSADIQAVVAADYIRNLREETKKGFYGRLKQGLYPMPAPIGYRDCGKGQPKAIDPVQGSLVKTAFELYASGTTGLNALVEKMTELGLRNRSGGKVTRNGLATIFHNPFYIGLIRVGRTGEYFVGQHQPIISKDLFDEVQQILQGKGILKKHHHNFLFRKQLQCGGCSKTLIAETHKGWVYYRCQNRACPETAIREETVEKDLLEVLATLQFDDYENDYLRQEIGGKCQIITENKTAQVNAVKLQQDQLKQRLSKLTDGYLDGVIDQSDYIEKKNNLLLQEKEITAKLERLERGDEQIIKEVEAFLELANNACLSYKLALLEEKREMVQIVTSNRVVKQKMVLFKLNYPFQLLADRPRVMDGSPYRAVPRTFAALVEKLIAYFTEQVITKKPSLLNEHTHP